MARLRVELATKAWGYEVMASQATEALLKQYGDRVAGQLTGGEVAVTSSGTSGFRGRRSRAEIRADVSAAEEARTGEMQAALRSIGG